MKNKLSDLNNHLFMQLERLGDEEISEEKLSTEISRSKAITDVADKVICNARLALDVQKALVEGKIEDTPEVLKVAYAKK